MSLAVLISEVFFADDDVSASSLPPLEKLTRLGDALADAVECLEDHLDAMGDELAAAVFVLLRDVRHGRIDRTSARVTAGVLVRHVGAAVGIACVGPLMCFLDALASLPDAARYERALDSTPDPSSEIEVAMAAMVADPGARGALRRALYAGTVVVPVLDLHVETSELSLQCLPVVVRGRPMVSVFTSPERVAEHAAAAGVHELPTMEISGDELASICPPGHGIAIDPGWVCGCVFEELEVRSLPHAPALVEPSDDCVLRAVVHPSVRGVLDAVRPQLCDFGVTELCAASRGADVVIAVTVDECTAPEAAMHRVGVALADLGLQGPVLVPSTSRLGRAVLALRPG